MAGKSTFLRQAALVVLLAQVGSFIPATSARFGLVDRIFTRVGAHDDVVNGASTFLVEMRETATICRQATPRSLVIVDEVGRGTSPEDGMAIAQAVAEHLHDHVGARTLFATHFHELAALANELDGLEPWTFDVVEEASAISFPHRMRRGVATSSHGLHVARLAGLPPSILERAERLISDSEGYQLRDVQAPILLTTTRHASRPGPTEPRPALAAEAAADYQARDESPKGNVLPIARLEVPAVAAAPLHARFPRVVEALLRIDVARTTPLQALNALAELQRVARSDDEA